MVEFNIKRPDQTLDSVKVRNDDFGLVNIALYELICLLDQRSGIICLFLSEVIQLMCRDDNHKHLQFKKIKADPKLASCTTTITPILMCLVLTYDANAHGLTSFLADRQDHAQCQNVHNPYYMCPFFLTLHVVTLVSVSTYLSQFQTCSLLTYKLSRLNPNVVWRRLA